MSEPANIIPNIKQFLDTKLPATGGMHTLVLGEQHDHSEHLAWLTAHLDSLRDTHNVGTIGLEMPVLINVFFWAYQDGNLKGMLGEENVKPYMDAIFAASHDPEFTDHAPEQARLATLALDKGFRVAAYDPRFATAKRKAAIATSWDNIINAVCDSADPSSQNQIEWGFRLDPSLRTAISHDRTMKADWLIHEAEWICNAYPEYRTRLNAIEHLDTIGQKKIRQGKITEDALSMCHFNAMSVPDKNHILIIGHNHINGVGCLYGNGPKIHEQHGIANHHLFALQGMQKPRPHQVTRAVIAGIAMADDIESGILKHEYDGVHKLYTGSQDTVPLLNIETGEVSSLPPPAVPKVANLEEKFPRYGTISDLFSGKKRRQEKDMLYAKTHINPLMVPEIKAAAANIAIQMNGPSSQIAR